VIGFAKKKNEKLRGAPDSMNEYFHPELLPHPNRAIACKKLAGQDF
jgi:hypothetical protein